MVFMFMNTTKSTSRRQGRLREEGSEGSWSPNVRAIACPGLDPGDRNRIEGLVPGRACLPVGRLAQHNKAHRFKGLSKAFHEQQGLVSIRTLWIQIHYPAKAR